MFKLATRLFALSAIGVLLLPGNEAHRDQVIRSMTAAYANTGDYCAKNREMCDRMFAQLRKASISMARQAVDLADDMTSSDAATTRPTGYLQGDRGTARYLQSDWRGIARTSDISHRQ